MKLEEIVNKICKDIINIMDDRNNKSFLEIFNELLANRYSNYFKYKIDILVLIPGELAKLGYEIDNDKLIKY